MVCKSMVDVPHRRANLTFTPMTGIPSVCGRGMECSNCSLILAQGVFSDFFGVVLKYAKVLNAEVSAQPFRATSIFKRQVTSQGILQPILHTSMGGSLVMRFDHSAAIRWDKPLKRTGWWFQHLPKILVNWDDYSQYMGK